MRNVCDVLIAVPSDDTPRIQECHILAGHALCDAVEGAVVASQSSSSQMSAGKKALFLVLDGGDQRGQRLTTCGLSLSSNQGLLNYASPPRS